MPEDQSTHTDSLPPLSTCEGEGFSLKPLLRRACPGFTGAWERLYENLFFDLDNTLWDFTENSRKAMIQTLTNNGLINQLESFDHFMDIYEQINHSLWSDYHSKKITKQMLIVERFSRSLSQFGIINQDWKLINENYLKNMALQTSLFPETIETLDTLKRKGYKMHIITNGFREVQLDKIKNSGLDKFFTKVFISEDIKTTKPHREIFEHALKSTNSRKQKSIMIGDSWETDILGALRFGMDQIMFLNNFKHPLPEYLFSQNIVQPGAIFEFKKGKKTYFVQNLSDLLTIL